MALELIGFDGALVLGAVLSAAVFAVAFRRREKNVSLALAVLMASVEGWIAFSLLSRVTTNPEWSVLWGKAMFLFVPTTVLSFLLFSLYYAGYDDWVDPQKVFVLSLHPLVVAVAVATNPSHRLLWKSVEAGGVWSKGPLWWTHGVYSYLVLLVATGLVVRELVSRGDAYRGQGVAIGVAVVVPFVANLAYALDYVRADLTPVGFVVTGLALLWGVRSYGLGEVAPVARRTLLENFGDGLVVVDDDGVVIQMNDVAREIFDLSGESVVGRPASEVFEGVAGFEERFAVGGAGEFDAEDGASDRLEAELDGSHTFDVQVDPLFDGSDDLVGRLFLIHDITGQKRRERELELQNRQLDQFASLVSHEIREPLAEVDDRLESVLASVSAEHRGDLLRARQALSDVDELVEDVGTMAREGSVVTREETDLVDLREVAVTVDVLEGPDGTTGFYVEDDGPGIPESARESVFRAGVSGSDSSPGLGLAIVETMAEAHGWEVSVTEGKSGGARFRFTGVDVPPREARRIGAAVGSATDD